MSPRILTDEERRQGLGGTDVAAIIGVSSYRAAIEVWQEKRGETPPQEQTWRMRLGQLFEDAICDTYSEQTGRRLGRMGVVVHKRYPFLYVHPDRRVIGEPGLVEAKKTALHLGDELPPVWRVQAQWQMGLTGRLWVDVVAFTGDDIDIRREERDQALIDDLVETAVAFWHDNVQAGVPPEVDGTDAYRHYLAAKYPGITEEERTATSEQVLLIDEYIAADWRAKAAKAEMDRIKNVLGDQMESAAVLLAPQAKVRRLMQAPSVSWKGVATDLAVRHGEDVEALAAASVAGREPEPYVRIYPKKEG